MVDFLKIANRAESTLDGTITVSGLSMDIDADNFPVLPFHLTLEDEIVRVTEKAGLTFTVTRGQESTSAASHDDGIAVLLNLTSAVLDGRTTWANNKLLRGTGAGSPPTEIDEYTDADAEVTVKTNVEVGELKTPTQTLAMGDQELKDLGYLKLPVGANKFK